MVLGLPPSAIMCLMLAGDDHRESHLFLNTIPLARLLLPKLVLRDHAGLEEVERADHTSFERISDRVCFGTWA